MNELKDGEMGTSAKQVVSISLACGRRAGLSPRHCCRHRSLALLRSVLAPAVFGVYGLSCSFITSDHHLKTWLSNVWLSTS